MDLIAFSVLWWFAALMAIAFAAVAVRAGVAVGAVLQAAIAYPVVSCALALNFTLGFWRPDSVTSWDFGMPAVFAIAACTLLVATSATARSTSAGDGSRSS